MSPTTHMASKEFIGAVEDRWDMYSDRSEDYTIGSPIGFGASSIVYSAEYKPQGSSSAVPCALKVLDLDSLPPHSLSLLQRETTLMSLSKHPNVLRVRGSWMDGHKLFIALRLMNKGSAADVMHYGWPAGLEEDVIRCILRQALLGLNYLHINGFIHRDVKAANLLIDDDGTVLLGDLGVAANLAEDTSPNSSKLQTVSSSYVTSSRRQNSSHDSQDSASGHSPYSSTRRVVLVEPTASPSRPKMGKRKSFVGTPCWMAPELIQGKNYDSSADIWSFGITALELTQGRPPRSRESPQKVLLKTIQEAAPTLDRDGGTYKYSRAFQEMVESCLVKDPTQRPTAEQLLQTQFFKGAKKPSYLIGTILKDLPPLTHRQERRVVPSTQTHRSIDSWDFATTIYSPGSVPRRRLPDESDNQGDDVVFEMENERDRESGRRSGSMGPSGTVSWNEPERPVLIEEHEPESDLVQSSASSSPSDSEFQGTSTTVSTSPETGFSTSPSSVREDAEPKTSQPVKEMPTPVFTALMPSSEVPVKPKLGISASPPQRGFWKKIKTNLRRSSSIIMLQQHLKEDLS
ncbi:STE/STE20/FRAY protein kinase [Desarmillaria tabescens]|uniref:STE/STE20/FRAY protein kinase n=1 Tax=Armillaria tabescens TaxID=1929756 RepID=A0AA39NGL1_ARMTA|nr:STE/STE20/FRAY protein kinase [Desarmillaria tabescens]KAK0465262.1 STE/STE20/FRAY protein kinase [Desarmillaria tabescens]